MSKLQIYPHYTEEELQRLEKQADSKGLRERIRAVRLLAFSPHSKKLICEMMGRSRTTLLTWCHRYNESGIEGLNKKPNLGGRVALCDQIGHAEIHAVISKPPADGGLWTGPKLRIWLEEKVGHPVGQTQGWKTLRRLGYTIQVPKPRNTKADPSRQASFKK